MPKSGSAFLRATKQVKRRTSGTPLWGGTRPRDSCLEERNREHSSSSSDEEDSDERQSASPPNHNKQSFGGSFRESEEERTNTHESQGNVLGDSLDDEESPVQEGQIERRPRYMDGSHPIHRHRAPPIVPMLDLFRIQAQSTVHARERPFLLMPSVPVPPRVLPGQVQVPVTAPGPVPAQGPDEDNETLATMRSHRGFCLPSSGTRSATLT